MTYSALQDKHDVTKAVEPVASIDGFLIGAIDKFFAGEGSYQHQKSGTGQVEIGEQCIDHAEPMAGQDVQAYPVGKRPDLFRRVKIRQLLQ